MWQQALRSLAVAVSLAWLVGCVGAAADRPIYPASLIARTAGASPWFGGPAVRLKGKTAVVAFNTVVYPERGAKPGPGAPAVATAGDLRDLTDAMLNAFLGEFRQLEGVELQPLAAIGANSYYRRLPGTPGTELGDLPLDGTMARLIAPAPLRYFDLPDTMAAEGTRELRGGTVLGDWLADWWTGHERLQPADFNLLCVKLQLDQVLLVNNRVRLAPAAARGWSARLELLEVLVVTAATPDTYAYARYVEGSFADPAKAPATDPLTPEGWVLLRPSAADAVPPATPAAVAPAADAAVAPAAPAADAAVAPATPARDFAGNAYWQAIADPYRQWCARFRQQLDDRRRD